jgi:hypothetical protein
MMRQRRGCCRPVPRPCSGLSARPPIPPVEASCDPLSSPAMKMERRRWARTTCTSCGVSGMSRTEDRVFGGTRRAGSPRCARESCACTVTLPVSRSTSRQVRPSSSDLRIPVKSAVAISGRLRRSSSPSSPAPQGGDEPTHVFDRDVAHLAAAQRRHEMHTQVVVMGLQGAFAPLAGGNFGLEPSAPPKASGSRPTSARPRSNSPRRAD